jgi:UDP-sulfoquinovose synthase
MNVIIECDKNIHLVHLGTMGVYGYGNVPDTVIPEGYVKIQMQNNKKEWKPCSIMHPYYPGSVYHTTKCLDNTLMSFYGKNYEIQITDLHQGIVWGLDTDETMMDPRLVNRLDCDSDYGTVLNRFVIQAAANKELTVYGTGEQTRAFIHIQNSMECIELAIENPKKPVPGEPLQIFNQMTETYRLLDLVQIIKKSFNEMNQQHYGREVQVKNCANPRKELIRNDLKVANKSFLQLGLQPISLLGLTELRAIYNHIQQVKKDHGFALSEKELEPCSFWTKP